MRRCADIRGCALFHGGFNFSQCVRQQNEVRLYIIAQHGNVTPPAVFNCEEGSYFVKSTVPVVEYAVQAG